MRVGFFPASTSHGHASSRIRCGQVFHWLQANTKLSVSQFDDEADVTVSFKRLNRKGRIKVLDLSDNHTGTPQQLRDIHDADLVVCNTEHLASAVRDAGARRVAVIPDAIDPVVAAVDPREPVPGRIMWFGNWGSAKHPGTGLAEIAKRAYVLEGAVRLNPDAHLVVICNDFQALPSRMPLPITRLYWNGTLMRVWLASASVVWLPSDITDYTICKSPNRMTTAIQAGVPVVASPLPAYQALGKTYLNDEMPGALAEPPPPIDQAVLEPYRIERVGALWHELLKGLKT